MNMLSFSVNHHLVHIVPVLRDDFGGYHPPSQMRCSEQPTPQIGVLRLHSHLVCHVRYPIVWVFIITHYEWYIVIPLFATDVIKQPIAHDCTSHDRNDLIQLSKPTDKFAILAIAILF
jgi:hypothetical protein